MKRFLTLSVLLAAVIAALSTADAAKVKKAYVADGGSS